MSAAAAATLRSEILAFRVAELQHVAERLGLKKAGACRRCRAVWGVCSIQCAVSRPACLKGSPQCLRGPRLCCKYALLPCDNSLPRGTTACWPALLPLLGLSGAVAARTSPPLLPRCPPICCLAALPSHRPQRRAPQPHLCLFWGARPQQHRGSGAGAQRPAARAAGAVAHRAGRCVGWGAPLQAELAGGLRAGPACLLALPAVGATPSDQPATVRLPPASCRVQPRWCMTCIAA